MRIFKILFLFLTLLFTQIFGEISMYGQQQTEVNLEETGLWGGVYVRGIFSKKWGYYGEHHLRARNSNELLGDFAGRFRQVYNRFGVSFQPHKHFELVVGPTLVMNFSPDPSDENYEKLTWEPRIWHQWLFSMADIGPFKIYHQFRFEHRWKRSNLVDAPYQFTHRFRYKFFAYVPLNKRTITTKTLYFSPSAEIFLHAGDGVVLHPFEDFRVYTGLGYVLNRNITLFGGHMWTLGQKSSGFQYRTSHVIRLNVFFSLDFRSVEDRMPPINLGY